MPIREPSLRHVEAAHRCSAFYRGYPASHLPMTVVALDQMGASDAQVDAFVARYGAALEPMAVPGETIAAGDEDRHLGRTEAFPAWVAYFASRIADRGAQAALREWVPKLLRAPGSGAFHGLIRTAYATDIASPMELAHALAYWASAYEPLPDLVPAGRASPLDVLRGFVAANAAGARPPGVNIAQRTLALAQAAPFAARVTAVDPEFLELPGIAALLIQAYAASGNFTVLHGVTGCHALRVLLPHARDRQLALQRFWVAIAAAHAGAGSPAIEGWKLAGSDALPWHEIHARAVRCEDEHDIKIAYSCWRESQATGNDLYRRVASAVVCAALAEELAC